MRDEHLIYTDLPDGKIKITAQEGYRLYCTLTRAYLSEAITTAKSIKYFVSEAEEGTTYFTTEGHLIIEEE